eukprot:CAMPEP_0172427956 /NCGR_PEP_ID=MMETSP1064-20121228/44319_1 /TAXON_ID=202472 /ORGANISM="Aulacoseira subarctica , Strain CCAP 1002/5" /LENGTH=109 /DNA_ID=CAMNT_0013172465 /DNA_START=42 /DNA_END=367 /DNA_ORIENTATION=+
MTTNAKDDDKEHKYNFSKINTKSELFKAKQLAFGKVTTRRGRPKTDNAGSGKGKKGEAANLDDAPTEAEDGESTETEENFYEQNVGLQKEFEGGNNNDDSSSSWDEYNR